MKRAISKKSPWRSRLSCLALLFASAASSAFAAEDGKRFAFLVGNDTYLQNPLKNSVNDARLMDRALKSVGFQTILLENAKKDEIEDKLGELADRVGPDDTVLFFYAGHAFQIESENYLVPVDFTPPKGIAQARSKCFSLSTLFQELKRSRARRTIVILDACRSNPFATVYSLAAGLAEPQNAGKETFIAFSTSPNHVAGDNPEGRNSWFTEALADLIEQPNETASITDIFARVIKRVQTYSGDRQTPWFTTNFSSKFYYRTPSNEVTESDASLADKWMSEAALREQRGTSIEPFNSSARLSRNSPAEPPRRPRRQSCPTSPSATRRGTEMRNWSLRQPPSFTPRPSPWSRSLSTAPCSERTTSCLPKRCRKLSACFR